MMDILIADDQFDVRSALRCLLEHEADLHLTGEAATAFDLLTQVAECCPDLLLLDWELPGMSMSDLLSRMNVIAPSLRIVALSTHPEADEEAKQAGVQAFVSKGDPPECLLIAMRRVLQ